MIARNFRWSDIPVLADFIGVVRQAAGDQKIATASLLKEAFGLPGLAPEENCTLFSQGQDLVAYSIVHPEPPIQRTVLDLCIRPEFAGKGFENRVVRTAIDRATVLGARVLHFCTSPSEFWTHLLEEEGFSRVREYWLMEWREEEVPAVQLREGLTIRSFQPGDAELLTRVQNASFGSSWGFCPNTVEQISYRTGMSIFPSEGVLFLNHGDDTAGYCWAGIEGKPGNSFGIIGMIGITPEFRGRGLSKPILLAGMDYLQSKGVDHIRLDVDGANTPATSLYISVGFKKAGELHWFEARLPET